MAHGPADGLRVADAIAGAPQLRGYPQLAAVRADLLGKLGMDAEAAAEYRRAAELSGNDREQAMYLERAVSLERAMSLERVMSLE